MKVAFATTDGVHIDEHFGWSKRFEIYEITADGYSHFKSVESPEDHDEEDDKINYKIESIKGASILFCQAIGPTAAAKVIKAKIHPVKIKEPVEIAQQAKELVALIGGNPPPWIKKILLQDSV